MDADSLSDSDISDSWSVINFNLGNGGVSADSTEDGRKVDLLNENGKIDECLELTEFMLSSSSTKTNPLSSAKSPEAVEESDDGISVISESEREKITEHEFNLNWRELAHENYRDTLKLLDLSKESPPTVTDRVPEVGHVVETTREDEQRSSTCKCKAPAPTLSECTMPGQQISRVSKETVIDAELVRAIRKRKKMGNDVVKVAKIRQDVTDVTKMTEKPRSWISTETIFAGAFFAVFAYLAISPLFERRCDGSREEWEKLRSTVDKIKEENILLSTHLSKLIYVYAILESKLNPKEFALPVGEPPMQPDFMRHFLLPAFLDIPQSPDPDPKKEALVSAIRRILNEIPEGYTAKEIQDMEDRIAATVEDLMNTQKTTFDINKLTKRVHYLGETLVNKLRALDAKRKTDTGGLNIVQWYSQDESEKPDGVPMVAAVDSVLNAVYEEKSLAEEENERLPNLRDIQAELAEARKVKESLEEIKDTGARQAEESLREFKDNRPEETQETKEKISQEDTRKFASKKTKKKNGNQVNQKENPKPKIKQSKQKKNTSQEKSSRNQENPKNKLKNSKESLDSKETLTETRGNRKVKMADGGGESQCRKRGGCDAGSSNSSFRSARWYFEKAKDRERTRRAAVAGHWQWELQKGRIPLETLDGNEDQDSWYFRKMSAKSRV